jgi:hypothetical protein
LNDVKSIYQIITGVVKAGRRLVFAILSIKVNWFLYIIEAVDHNSAPREQHQTYLTGSGLLHQSVIRFSQIYSIVPPSKRLSASGEERRGARWLSSPMAAYLPRPCEERIFH